MTDLKERHAQVIKSLLPVLERRIERALEISQPEEANALLREVRHNQEILAELEAETALAS
jgi:uncharacterized protein (DUF1697 family)